MDTRKMVSVPRKLIKDDEFVNYLELCAWTFFVDKMKNFLCNLRAENYKE